MLIQVTEIRSENNTHKSPITKLVGTRYIYGVVEEDGDTIIKLQGKSILERRTVSEAFTAVKSSVNNALADDNRVEVTIVPGSGTAYNDQLNVWQIIEARQDPNNANLRIVRYREEGKLADIEIKVSDTLADILTNSKLTTTAITSVNGKTGAVIVLDPDDLDDSATAHKFVSQTEVDKLGNISVTQPVDLDQIEADATGSVTVHSDVNSAGSGDIITAGERADITGSVTVHSDVNDAGSGDIITTAERNLLNQLDWTGDRVVYVGKHGDDSNDGSSHAKAFETVQAAANQAVTNGATFSDPWTVHVVDAGEYQENITLAAGVFLYAPNASFLDLAAGIIIDTQDKSKVWVYEINVIAPTSTGIRTSTSGTSVVHIDTMRSQLGGTCVSLEDPSCYVDIGGIILSGGSTGVEYNNATSGDASVSINEIRIQGGAGNIAVKSTLASEVSGLKIGKIFEPSTGTGTAFDIAANETMSVIAGEVSVTDLSNVGAGGELNLTAGRASGAQGGAGTTNIIQASDKALIDANTTLLNQLNYDHERVIYVNKTFGDDSNDGRSMAFPKATIQAANNQAVTNGANLGTEFSVKVIGADSYLENVTLAEGVHLDAAMASIVGPGTTLTLANNSRVIVRQLGSSGPAATVVQKNTTAAAFLNAEQINVPTNGIGYNNSNANADSRIRVGRILLQQNSVGVVNNSTSGSLDLDIGDIVFTGTNGFGVRNTTTTSQQVSGKIGRIWEDGGTGTAFDLSANALMSVTAGYVQCAVVVNNAAGSTFNCVAGSVTGAENGTGVKNIIEGSDQSTYLESATSRIRPRNASGNVVNANTSVISGGSTNTIGANSVNSVVGGGVNNDVGISSLQCVIGGGNNNNIANSSSSSSMLGGAGNNIGIISANATLVGGSTNTISSNCQNAFIGGGSVNTINSASSGAIIVGGVGNTINTASTNSSIIGGNGNTINTGVNSVIGGGYSNTITGQGNGILSGVSHVIDHEWGVICGGYANSILGGSGVYEAFIGAGYTNEVSVSYGSIINGLDNTVTGDRGIVLNGSYNTVSAGYSTIINGSNNNTGVFTHVAIMGVSITANRSNCFFMESLDIRDQLYIQTGLNKSIGTAVLVGGTVTVNTTAVTANSIIMLTNQITGGTIGVLSVGLVTAGVSFVINSSSGTDTSTVGYLIIN